MFKLVSTESFSNLSIKAEFQPQGKNKQEKRIHVVS